MLSLLVTNVLYSNTIGVIAGNIIAAIPAVQLAVKSEIATGLYVVMAAIISGCHMDAIQARDDVPIKEAITAFWILFIASGLTRDYFKFY